MRKVSLLIGALGGAVAGYLFSNSNLRDELSQAGDADDVAQIIRKHFKKDTKRLGDEVKDFLEREDIMAAIEKAKGSAKKKVTDAKKEVKTVVRTGAARARKAVKQSASRAGSVMETKVRKVSPTPKKKRKKPASRKKK